jgi:hypothetical protein
LIRAGTPLAVWQSAVLERIEARVHFESRNITVPAQAGGWMHDAVCQEHWGALRYDVDSPHAHQCPEGELRVGPREDGAWLVGRHRQLAALARDAALVASVTGKRAPADVSNRILDAYADLYASFDGARDARPEMLTGHAFQQALTEAIWAVPLAYAHRLLGPRAGADRIATDLLRPIAATLVAAQDRLLAAGRPRSNFHAWLLAAIGTIGVAIGDEALIERATEGPAGFRAHLNAAVLADGFEHEGSPYYHAFVALAYSLLAEAVAPLGIDLFAYRGDKGQSIDAMCSALVTIALPDWSIPQLNDGTYWDWPLADHELNQLLEIAYARTAQTEFGAMLSASYERRGASRDSWTALLFGRQELPPGVNHKMASGVLDQVGIAILRSADAGVFMPYGEQPEEHLHRDSLSLNVWPVSVDPGNPPYGVTARRDWYQQTAAHNCVVVAGLSQSAGQGRLLERSDTEMRMEWVEPGTRPGMRPGMRIERHVHLNGRTIRDSCQVELEQAEVVDWLLHSEEPFELVDAEFASASGPLGEGAYAFIEVVGRVLAAERAVFKTPGFRLEIESDGALELIAGRCPGSATRPAKKRWVLIARRHARSIRYLATFELEKKA